MTIPTLKRILFVEDDPDIQVIAQFALEELGGFVVEICDSGMKATTVVSSFAPDLIVLDVMMPGMDGITTLKALRDIPEVASTPILFMTAKVQTHEVQNYRAMGAIDVIAKPFDPMTLSSTIQTIWEKYHEP